MIWLGDKMNKDYANKHSYKIPQVDASNIYKYSAADGGLPLCVKNSSKPDKSVFVSDLRYCLETEEMEKLAPQSFENGYSDVIISVTFELPFSEYNAFSHYDGLKGTLYVKNGYYFKDGFVTDRNGEKYTLDDCILIVGNDIAAIMTSTNSDKKSGIPVEVYENKIGKVKSQYFAYDSDNKQYTRKCELNKSGQPKTGKDGNLVFTGIDNILSSDELRGKLYDDGFFCINKLGEKVHYVRYKRSAGMGREGKCLFITENVYRNMEQWGTLNPENENFSALLRKYSLKFNGDTVPNEAYKALTLSSIEEKINIELSSILFLEDKETVFDSKCVCVHDNGDNSLSSETEKAEVHNVIWDGEALLEKSVFDEVGRGDKGMMLLRNKYFKTCAFNTNIQEFFKWRHIDSVCQLNGFTLAKDISEIKMIVTESSLKFCKLLEDSGEPEYCDEITEEDFEASLGLITDVDFDFDIDSLVPWEEKKYTDIWCYSEFQRKLAFWIEWLGDERNIFGVVKSEKPSHYLGGKIVSTSYQLINTVPLQSEETAELLAPMNMLKAKLRSSPDFMRYYLSDFASRDSSPDGEDEISAGESELFAMKYDLISSIIGICPQFEETGIYHDFRSEVISGINDRIKRGRVFVHGTNATIFGNGYQLLLNTIRDDLEPNSSHSESDEDIIYCPFFKEGTKLLCARSPHITMGNLMIAANRKKAGYIFRFFNLTPEIVYVSAYDRNIQHKLNGCDYDSDTMLITDNPVLVEMAGKFSDLFPVPFNGLGSVRTDVSQSLKYIDIAIGKNKIGEIVNLSQRLNGILWSMIFKGVYPDEVSFDIFELYGDICKLAVLSNTEIDKAKRVYPVDVDKVLRELRTKYITGKEELFPVPEYYKYITGGNTSKPKEKSGYYLCPMEYMYMGAYEKAGRGKKCIGISDLLQVQNIRDLQDDTADALIALAEKVSEKRKRYMSQIKANARKYVSGSSSAGLQKSISNDTAQFFEEAAKLGITEKTVLSLISKIDEARKKDTKNGIRDEHWLLLASLCNSGKGKNISFSFNSSNAFQKMLAEYTEAKGYDPEKVSSEINSIFNI